MYIYEHLIRLKCKLGVFEGDLPCAASLAGIQPAVRRNTASAVYIGIYGGGWRGNEALAAKAASASFPRHPPPYKIIKIWEKRVLIVAYIV